LLREGFDVVEHALDRAATDPHCAAARRWLALARSSGPRLVEPLRRASGRDVPLQPCLRDARPEHLLFSGDRVTGLIDFGAMAIENVAADLARLLGDWVGPDTSVRAEALDAYTAVRPLETVEIAMLDVFEDSSALLGAGHWVRWHFLEGRTFPGTSPVAGGIERGLKRLASRAVAWEGVGRGVDWQPGQL
jgi:homoserine kinase type II